MVTNESPDGYALMHVSGKTARLAAGDIVAIRTETDFGLADLYRSLGTFGKSGASGTRAANSGDTRHICASGRFAGWQSMGSNQPVLILPQIPPMRTTEALVAPAGTAQRGRGKLVLLVEQDNLEIREMLATHLDEQTSSIEVIAIEPSKAP